MSQQSLEAVLSPHIPLEILSAVYEQLILKDVKSRNEASVHSLAVFENPQTN
jgi:hypothetical protein